MGLFSGLGKGKQVADDEIDVPVRPRRRAAKAQDEEPLDPMLPEKKRARRRLIGASALVLAAIIGLPMIFDSEPKPLTDDIAIQIPSRDKQGAGLSTNAMPPLPEQPVETKKTAPANNAESSPASDVKPDANTGAVPIPVPAQNAAVASNLKSGGDKAEHKSAAKPASNEKAASIKLILQVAAVNSKSKADELQAKLKQAGIKSYLQKITTKDGERYRIRVGPFGSRDDAEKMRLRLTKMGLSVAVQSV